MAKIVKCDVCGNMIFESSRSIRLSIKARAYTKIRVLLVVDAEMHNDYPPFASMDGDICKSCLGQALIDSARGIDG